MPARFNISRSKAAWWICAGTVLFSGCLSPKGGGIDGGGGAKTPGSPGSDADLAGREQTTVFFSGHSLINLEMPSMLDSLATNAGRDHVYQTHIGAGSTQLLRWTTPMNGQQADGASMSFHFKSELQTGAVAGRPYDTLIVTEAVPLFSQFQYSCSNQVAERFHAAISDTNADARVFLYESWEEIDVSDPTDWHALTESNRVLWKCIAGVANRTGGYGSNPMRVLPAARALKRLVEEVEAGNVPGIATVDDLFADAIHGEPVTNYYIALVVYAFVYERSPVGLSALTFSSDTADALQALAWEFSSPLIETGGEEPLPTIEECRMEVKASFCSSGYCETTVDESIDATNASCDEDSDFAET